MRHSQKRARLSAPSPESTTGTSPAAHLESTSSGDVSTASLVARQKGILLDAPLDIIHEIFRHLYPLDLFNLARTNTSLREFLMDEKRSKGVWRMARRNIEGLPDCPPHMSEARYADLAFNPYCHGCSEPGSHTVVWELAARYCDHCLSGTYKVVWSDARAEVHFEDVLGRDDSFDWARYLPCYTPVDNDNALYDRSACEDLAKRVLALRGHEDALDAYLGNLETVVEGIRQHGKACHKWYHDFLEQRLEDIVAKLREQAWGHVLDTMSEDDFAPLRSHPAFTHPRVFTNDEWSEIRDPIVELLEEYDEGRLYTERLSLIRTRLLYLRRAVCKYQLSGPRRRRTVGQEFHPKFADIALMPEFRALVEAADDVEVTEGTFRRLCAELPRLTKRFESDRRNELREMMAQGLGHQVVRRDVLALAVAWFHCDACQRYTRWPEVLAHRCQRPHYATTAREDFEDAYEYDVAEAAGFHAWSTQDLRPVLAEDLAALRALIVACGLDPERATAEEMDARDVRVTCDEIKVAYARKSEGKLVMNWRRAVLSLHKVRGHEKVGWTVVSDADKRRARPLERKAREAALAAPENRRFIQCALCDESWWLATECHGDVFLVAHHLAQAHGIASGEAEDYMFRHPDGVPETPEVWLPFSVRERSVGVVSVLMME